MQPAEPSTSDGASPHQAVAPAKEDGDRNVTTSALPRGPLELPGWIEFHTWRTGLRAQEFSEAIEGGAELRAVLYLDGRGRIRVPYLNPYLPITFRSLRPRPRGRTADWLKVTAPLVDEMRRRGVPNLIYLPPEVQDVRPWQWQGFMVGADYTYRLDLPLDPASVDRSHKKNGDKAAKFGMTVDRVTTIEPIIECLTDSSQRVGYVNEIGPRELRRVADLLGEDSLRMYACRDSTGRVAAAVVLVHVPGTYALGWLFGTKTEYLTQGAGQLVWRSAFADIVADGATGVDFGGPNSRGIAEFKSRWGSRLAPMYSVRGYSTRSGARFVSDWLRSSRSKRSAAALDASTAEPADSASREHTG